MGNSDCQMTADPQALGHAAEAIRAAESLVLMADTGIGAEAGRAEFHDNETFWRTYPPLVKLGIGFEALATPQAFERDPALAWGYYGQRIERCRHSIPHAGFAILRHWLEAKPQSGFVFTSCVDGCFQRGGFAEERIVECHGSLEHLQCVKPCCAATWPAPADLQLAVDPETMRAGGALPRCVRCGGLARPNVLMAEDGAWSSGRTLAQQVRFRAWQGSLARGRFGVIEIGTDGAGLTVRQAAEQLAAAGRVPLIRIQSQATPESPNTIPLIGEVAAVLQELAALMT
jgi:NAD-dependent SIR2 family protein deacetylase